MKYTIKTGKGNVNENTKMLNDMAADGYSLVSAYSVNNQEIFIFEQKTTRKKA